MSDPYLDSYTMQLLKPLLIASEGLRLKTYRCPAGKLTIGYGHTGPDVTEGMEITHKKAEALLLEDLQWVAAAMQQTIKVELAPHQKAALASLIYNIGGPAWRGSTALRRLNAGDLEGAAEALTWWDKVTRDGKKVVLDGLVRRRRQERDLLLSAAIKRGAVVEDPPTPGTVTGGEQKRPRQSVTTWLSGLGLTAVLTDMAGIWQQIKSQAPEIVTAYGPHIIVGLILLGLLARRMQEMRKGIH